MSHPTTLPTEPLRSHAQAQSDLAATLAVPDDAPRATDEAREQLFERLKKTPVAMVVTDLAVIAFPDGRATLVETAPSVMVADVVKATEAELVIPDHVPEMRFCD